MHKTNVVLADDHPLVRKGIRALLGTAKDIEIVGEASNGIEAVQLAVDLCPDVLLLDMEMPGMGGLEVTKHLRKHGHELPYILVISAYEDKQYILSMLKMGVAGYLTKDEVPRSLVKAVRGVVRGEQGWVSSRVAAQLAVWDFEQSSNEVNLSKTQIEILRKWLDGYSFSEISLKVKLPECEVEQSLEDAVTDVRKHLSRSQ